MNAHHNLHKLIGSVNHLTRPETHGCLPSSHAKNLHTKRFLWERENDSGLIESKIEPKYESRRARIAIGRGRSLTCADGSPTPLDRGWGAAGGQRIRRARAEEGSAAERDATSGANASKFWLVVDDRAGCCRGWGW